MAAMAFALLLLLALSVAPAEEFGSVTGASGRGPVPPVLAYHTAVGDVVRVGFPSSLASAGGTTACARNGVRWGPVASPRRRLILMPTFPAHFSEAIGALTSLLTFAADPEELSMRLVTGSIEESRSLRERIERTAFRTCAAPGVASGTDGAHALDVGILDILSIGRAYNVSVVPYQSNFSMEDKSGVRGGAPHRNKYLWQFIKKLYGARFFGAEQTLVLDSESRALRPFSARAVWDSYFAPGAFPNVPLTIDRRECRACMHFLGGRAAVHAPKGPQPCAGGFQWFWRRDIVAGLFARVEALHRRPLYEVASELFQGQRCFEVFLYAQYVFNNRPLRAQHRFVPSAAWFEGHKLSAQTMHINILSRGLMRKKTGWGKDVLKLAQLVDDERLTVARVPVWGIWVARGLAKGKARAILEMTRRVACVVALSRWLVFSASDTLSKEWGTLLHQVVHNTSAHCMAAVPTPFGVMLRQAKSERAAAAARGGQGPAEPMVRLAAASLAVA